MRERDKRYALRIHADARLRRYAARVQRGAMMMPARARAAREREYDIITVTLHTREARYAARLERARRCVRNGRR